MLDQPPGGVESTEAAEAFEPIRVAWPDERLIHCDERVIVVDKPRGLPVHGGNVDFDDVVTRVARFCRDRGESDYLAVHSRLDKEVSGVLVFGRLVAENPAIAREYESHQVAKCYYAIVHDAGLPAKFIMRDRLQPSERGPTRVVGSAGVEAETECRVLARHAGRALVELWPKTGRRHQLRVQLAHRGAAICGDNLYNGDAAPRLMLHAAAIESKALGWQFTAPLPEEFADFGLTESLGSAARLKRALFDASWQREPLLRRTDVMRLVNASGDSVPGIAVDRFADWAVIELFSDEAVARREEVVRCILELGARGVYAKCRVRRDLRRENVEALAPPTPDLGEPAPEAFSVHEQGLPFEVRLGDGWDVGLYVDQRENRRRVHAASRGKRILNLFGYTGSFSVAAACGGAQSTMTIDISGRALDRARRNFEFAGIDIAAGHEFLRADVVHWLERAAREARHRFDLIILDPPSFSTVGRNKVFRLADRWDQLLQHSLQLLSSDGEMLVISHERTAGPQVLRRRILRAAERAGRSDLAVRDIGSAADVPPGPSGPWPSFGLWVAVRQSAR